MSVNRKVLSNVKNTALAGMVSLIAAMPVALAQNAPAKAPAAAVAPVTATAAPATTTAAPAKVAPAPAAAKAPTSSPAPTPTVVSAKPTESPKPGQPAAANAVAKPTSAAANDSAKEPAKEPAATAAKAAEASKNTIAEIKKPLTIPPCPIAEFRAIGMETSDVVARRAKALDWLARKGKQCSPEKLVAIRNNRPQWMGHADSTVVAAAVDSLLESSIEGNPQVLNLLYGTQPPPPKPPEEKKPAK